MEDIEISDEYTQHPELMKLWGQIVKTREEMALVTFELYGKTGNEELDTMLEARVNKAGLVNEYNEMANHPMAKTLKIIHLSNFIINEKHKINNRFIKELDSKWIEFMRGMEVLKEMKGKEKIKRKVIETPEEPQEPPLSADFMYTIKPEDAEKMDEIRNELDLTIQEGKQAKGWYRGYCARIRMSSLNNDEKIRLLAICKNIYDIYRREVNINRNKELQDNQLVPEGQTAEN